MHKPSLQTARYLRPVPPVRQPSITSDGQFRSEITNSGTNIRDRKRQQSTVFVIEERKENNRIRTVHLKYSIKRFISKKAMHGLYHRQHKRGHIIKNKHCYVNKKTVYTLDNKTHLL